MPTGPFDQVELTQDLRFEGLDGPVHVVRDQYGIAHIHAESLGDLGFAQGYVMAHDRLPQMDILRRFGAGTLAELFGALDADVVETDLEMRVHRMKPLAEEALAELRASTDPIDAEIVTVLDRFADGVNAYNADLVGGKYQLDPAIAVSYDPARFDAWSPVDSVVLGRFQAFALSWTTPVEVDVTDIHQQARDLFDNAPGPQDPNHDPDRYARRGAAADLLRLTPVGKRATIDGFPNVDPDTGTRADGDGRQAAAGPKRPRVPRELLANARRFFRSKLAKGPHSFMVPRAGSNNWAVGPALAGGKALLAGDQHLSLPNPSIFYPVHLTVPGKVDVEGITFPGIPGIVLGSNGKVAWSATVVFHDVNDVYLEDIHPCPGASGDCVTFDGAEVPVETWTEEIRIGALGTITETKTVTYERVPHHGPLIPTIENRQLVPRTGPQGLSVRYTGYAVTNEIRAIYRLSQAQDVAEAFSALAYFQFGGQNWTMIDNTGRIAWTSNADVPLRGAAAYTWDPETNPDGVSPLFVLPADGSAEWEGQLDSRYIPHAIDPAQGFLVTANSDPVGATFDGKLFNSPVVDGRPLYVGATYAPGLRTERITAMIEERAAAGALTIEDMAAIQADSQSTVGAHMQPLIAAIFAAGTPPGDVTTWRAGLPAGRAARLDAIAARLAAWTLATPPAVEGSPSAQEVSDSVATSVFNVWVHYFLDLSIGDEMAALGWSVYDVNENLTVRVILALLAEPDAMVSGLAAGTQQPILCDDMRTAQVVESCDLAVWRALDAAVTWLESSDGFETADADAWVWGRMHTLTLQPLFPEDALNVPPRSDPNPDLRNGYPRAGDNFVINRADCGWGDLDFSQNEDGPAQRFLAEVEPGGTIRVRMALPGGTIYNRDSSHYRDLMDQYYIPNRHFDLPFSIEEIVTAGEERWLLRP
ncbi:MAG TPA: penicillin acylase family protein [Kofleriaceae bacterium]|nr:penicillin acylase family protein [Kofleriaceae bacterium]